jgi:hypothetical protein
MRDHKPLTRKKNGSRCKTRCLTLASIREPSRNASLFLCDKPVILPKGGESSLFGLLILSSGIVEKRLGGKVFWKFFLLLFQGLMANRKFSGGLFCDLLGQNSDCARFR